MATSGRQSDELSVTPSLLDRLFDNRPLPPWERTERERELRMQSKRFHNIQDLKRCVARDLELLLNTKREIQDDLTDEFDEVQKSVVMYGLPDFTAASLSNHGDRKRVGRTIEQAITNHEPRLRRVRVTVDDPKVHDRALRFRVDALLHVEPAREMIVFDAVLQLNTQKYQIKGKD